MLQNFLDKKGKLKTSQLEKSEDLHLIIEQTNFLPDDSSILERVFCIKNSISELSICQFCGNKRSFVKYRGYKETCGNVSCGLKLRYSKNENREITGLKTSQTKHDNKRYYRDNLLNLDRFKNLSITKPSPNFSSLDNINNWLAILANSNNVFEVCDIPTFSEIKARYLGLTSGFPKCSICEKTHFNFNKRTGTFNNTCNLEFCKDQEFKNGRIDNFSNKILPLDLPLGFSIIKVPNLITKEPVDLLCNNGHYFSRWLHGVYRHKIICPYCDPLGSSYENEIVGFLRSLGIENIERNTRQIIPPKELDIYLPDFKLAIEFHGLYWHSFSEKETTLQKNSHQFKFLKCLEQDITLIQIFENEWKNKQDILKSRIIHKLGKSQIKVFARKCEVRTITSSEASEFLDETHFQGGSVKCSVNYGLFFMDSLLAVMTFGKPRFNKNFEWELIRFSSKGNIVGGANKIFSHFKREHSPHSVISYSDNRFGTGNLYLKLGFTKSGISKPNFYYLKNNEIFSRYKYQKHKMPKKIENFDSNLTAEENMFNNKYRRLWDAGSTIWTY